MFLRISSRFQQHPHFLLTAALAVGLCACATRRPSATPDSLTRALEQVRQQHAPDRHLNIFTVGIENAASSVTLTGCVDNAVAHTDALAAVRAAGFRVTDRIEVLPLPDLGDATWGLASVSVASGREQPQNMAEMGTQILMGHPVRVWKRTGGWYLAQSADRYVCWLPQGTIRRCTRAELDAWNASPLLIVTAFDDCIHEQPRTDALPVADVVLGCLVKRIGTEGDWFKVELPDGQTGYLPKNSVEDYATWKSTRRPTPENIERTARSLMGRPYLWGANTPRGLDCSGFTKLVFFLNGIDLDRNASHQGKQGVEVPLDPEFSRLRKGDLLFFGAHAGRGRPERITHTGIYLEDKLFIHSSERVRINSLDPDSPNRDARRIRSLLHARRLLPEQP
jgi:hypothetical protein